ncbi:MAG: phosphatase PAP2 family protein [Aeromicrobium sp.]
MDSREAVVGQHRGAGRTSGGRSSRSVGRAMLELAIITTLYLGYRFGRLVGLGREDVARTHAELVHQAERLLHLPSEASIQAAVAHVPDVYELANHYYVTLHFPVIVAFLLWGFFARPRPEYLWARNLLITQTALALVIHIAFPLAPPRMFPQWGFVDTMQVFGPDAYDGAGAAVANQYAAMPSLHIGWAVLVAVVLVRTAPRPLATMGVLHAVTTVLVVVITANHWLLDGMVATALLGVGLLLFPGPGRYRVHPRALWRRVSA